MTETIKVVEPASNTNEKNLYTLPDSSINEESSTNCYPNNELQKANFGDESNQENVSLENLNFSLNQSTVGSAIKNPTATVVNCKSASEKLYSCKYCGKLLKGKIARHLTTVHKNEKEIKELNLIPKVHREKGKKLNEAARARLKIIAKERNYGNFKYNLKASTSEVAITVRRTGMNMPLKTLDNFRTCPKCKGFFGKASIYKHIPKCLGVNLNGTHPINFLNTIVIGDIHEKANPQLRKVAAKLRQNDSETTVIKYDPLIIAYGNLQASKFQTSQHHGSQIRAELRLLARLVLQLREFDKTITELSCLYDPTKFEVFIKAVNVLGKFDEVHLVMKSPATARDIGRLVKIIKKIWVLECSENNNQERLEKAKAFMRSFKIKFPILIGATVSESQTQMNIAKGAVKLPTLTDIQKLTKYLVERRREAYNKLHNIGYDFVTWKKLAETTLISILLLNRRRPGELERLKLVHYNSLEKINEKTNFDLYKKLNNNSKIIARKYSRILIRGKKNKKIVPVLLDREMDDSIKLILYYRKNAGIPSHNPYVFALPSVGQYLKWIDACHLLRKFAKDAKVDMPDTIRATELRKHIATTGISLNLSNNEVQNLSNYMGHDIKIHLGTYRQRLPMTDILQMSQLLEKAQGVAMENDGQILSVDSGSENDEREFLTTTRSFKKLVSVESESQIDIRENSVTEEDSENTCINSLTGMIAITRFKILH